MSADANQKTSQPAPLQATEPALESKRSAMLRWLWAIPLFFLIGAVGSWVTQPILFPKELKHETADGEHTKLIQSHEDPEPHGPKADLATADALYREGKYGLALQAYDAFAEMSKPHVSDSLHFRIALCQEGLRQWEQALLRYQNLASTASSPESWAAILGQARVLVKLERWSAARDLLDILLLKGDELPVGAQWLAEARYTLALALALERLPHQPPDPLEPNLALPRLHFGGLARFLDVLPETPMKPRDKDTIVVHPNPNKADQMIAKASVAMAPAREVFERLILAADLTPQWSIKARQQVEGRTAQIALSDWTLLDTLRSLGEPFDLVCTIDGDHASLEMSEEKDDAFLRVYRASRMQSVASSAILLHPDHPLAAATCLLLGNAQASGRKATEAQGWYRRVLRDMPRSEPHAEACYNLGLILADLGEAAAARTAFFELMDHAPHHELAPVAGVRAGLALLEEGDTKKAAGVFRRVLAAAADQRTRATAAVALAASLALGAEPQLANAALTRHRDAVQSEPFRSTAALVAAFARYRVTGGAPETRREANDLLAALLGASQENALGRSGKLLIGMGYAQLGMWEQAAETYRKALETVHGPLREEMRFRLADALANDHEADAIRMLTEQVKGSGVWSHHARFRLAQLDLRGRRWESCIEHCRRLLREATPFANADVLSIMGRAYEGQGNFVEAARCFAGELPEG